jgi:tetratricopeptide (TPR) repeat protein
VSRKLLSLLVLVVLAVPTVFAQSLRLPDESPAAQVGQRIGLSDITISYHRPQVKGRTVFGGLVPYGQVWRAGANENTTITFTDDVTIEGKPLAKGTYGLHMLPAQNDVTVIFSKANQSWGSYTYDEKEDALRVQVKQQPSEFHESLTYDFADVKPDSAVAVLQWDKTAIPFRVAIDLNKTVEARVSDTLRGQLHWQWEAFDQAATYILAHKGNLNDALTYSSRSVELEPHFSNLFTQSRVFDALGKTAEAQAARVKATPLASNLELYNYARWQQHNGQAAQSVETFRKVAQMNPDHWIAHLALARVYSGEKKFPEAQKEIQACMSTAPADLKNDLKPLQTKLNSNQDIN